jgi:hypothetical protein
VGNCDRVESLSPAAAVCTTGLLSVERISGWSGPTAATKVSLPSSAYTYRLLASLTLDSEIPEEIGRLDCTEEGVDV